MGVLKHVKVQQETKLKLNFKQLIMNLKNKLTLFVMLFFNIALFAQSTALTGKVVSATDDIPIPGVNVIVMNTSRGTTTDFDGNYQIEVKSGDVLQFSYVGFVSQKQIINNQSTINVSLLEDKNQLDEVVVIGYGTQKKANLTGSISKLVNKKLDQSPSARIDDALKGQIAGVNILSSNTAAGEAPTITVRGQGSISFESNPLIVIDGIVVGTDTGFLSSIGTNDVESIEVLKDASSSAIYGSRGANGVIVINTKKGIEGPPRFSYNTYMGYQYVPNNDVLGNISEWTKFVLANNSGVLTDELKYIQKLGTVTDWQALQIPGGTIQNHALSVSGGSKDTKYIASLSYLDDQGVLLTDSYQKLNFRINLDSKVNDKVSFGIVLNPSRTTQRIFPPLLHDALRHAPWAPVRYDENSIQYVNRFRENGRYSNVQVGDYVSELAFDDYDLVNGIPSQGNGVDISSTGNSTAYADVVERNYKVYQTKIFANAYVSINLAKDIFFKQSIGGDYRNLKDVRYTGIYATRNGARDSRSSESNRTELHSVSESTFSLNKEIGNHSIDAVVGFAYEKWTRESSSLLGSGYDSDLITTIPQANLVGGESSKSEENLISYLSRVNYSYDDRYLLSVSARFDGSSKFGPNNKFGFFPAASVGWRISNEEFLKENNTINELKVRASLGLTGSNSGIGEYDYIGLISPVGTGINGAPNGYNPINVSNPELGWEKLIEFNPGIDASFFAGKFSFSLDYYIRKSKDLLLSLPIPSITGFDQALVNKGEVENKGFELELRTRNISNENFSWTSSAILTHNKNTLIDFAGASGLISVVDSRRPAEFIALEGHPISSFYGYVKSGKEIDLQYIKNPFYPINAQSQDTYVKDLNGDGIISSKDRTILGNPNPDLIWSFSNNFEYKNFDLSFMFQGSHGAEIRNIDSQYYRNEFSTNQDYTSNFPDADLVQQRIFTDEDIQDASYIALRNLNFGYSIPKSVLEKLYVQKIRIYFAAQNLLYLMAKDYESYNPEGINEGQNNPLTYGYQRGASPIFKTVSMGFNIEF